MLYLKIPYLCQFSFIALNRCVLGEIFYQIFFPEEVSIKLCKHVELISFCQTSQVSRHKKVFSCMIRECISIFTTCKR
ncbi:hypothetical protein FKM82_018755 [Ascaphus truei]